MCYTQTGKKINKWINQSENNKSSTEINLEIKVIH